jgi:hypothetical protein
MLSTALRATTMNAVFGFPRPVESSAVGAR